MEISMREYLQPVIESNHIQQERLQIPTITLNAESIKVLMINEVPPQNPDDYFYSNTLEPDYMKTTLSLFHNANVPVNNIQDIIDMGIYITTAVKSPKDEYTVSTENILSHLPILEQELKAFPNLSVIMLMGDVAKKSFNLISKKIQRKIPSPQGLPIK